MPLRIIFSALTRPSTKSPSCRHRAAFRLFCTQRGYPLHTIPKHARPDTHHNCCPLLGLMRAIFGIMARPIRNAAPKSPRAPGTARTRGRCWCPAPCPRARLDPLEEAVPGLLVEVAVVRRALEQPQRLVDGLAVLGHEARAHLQQLQPRRRLAVVNEHLGPVVLNLHDGIIRHVLHVQPGNVLHVGLVGGHFWSKGALFDEILHNGRVGNINVFIVERAGTSPLAQQDQSGVGVDQALHCLAILVAERQNLRLQPLVPGTGFLFLLHLFAQLGHLVQPVNGLLLLLLLERRVPAALAQIINDIWVFRVASPEEANKP
ncbi:hypothetical protein CRV24_000763 [Beauveria bassiana]|nr:hypothetical protein CRV24_000763 [Beauveria bassiana]